eukprot:TRINITY_DN20800_c0_g3_i4.p1 TRINITY_DN20800_c0_g3~~TRINITY_DN20800_c0_g3_i4.p1  ORF type:complete len:188 (+),score=-28.70 TRINITY_DN20800_c0_g3_i4:467-1030(+)
MQIVLNLYKQSTCCVFRVYQNSMQMYHICLVQTNNQFRYFIMSITCFRINNLHIVAMYASAQRLLADYNCIQYQFVQLQKKFYKYLCSIYQKIFLKLFEIESIQTICYERNFCQQLHIYQCSRFVFNSIQRNYCNFNIHYCTQLQCTHLLLILLVYYSRTQQQIVHITKTILVVKFNKLQFFSVKIL